MIKKSYIISIVVIVSFLGTSATWVISKANKSINELPAVIKKVPDFSMTSHIGENFNQDSLLNKISIIEFIYGAFVNTIVEFQRLTISLKDLFFKIMGIVVTFLYFVDGSIKALTSLWKGPVGGAIRGVGKFRVPRIRFLP